MVLLRSLAYSKSTAVMAEIPAVGILAGSTVLPKHSFVSSAILACHKRVTTSLLFTEGSLT
jgi:hypothetical protein